MFLTRTPKGNYNLVAGFLVGENDVFIHNKLVEGISPAIYWYDDRLEVVSYGMIPNGMTKDDFLSGKTHPVNEELMKIFYNVVLLNKQDMEFRLLLKNMDVMLLK